jgi:hypothetical protein
MGHTTYQRRKFQVGKYMAILAAAFSECNYATGFSYSIEE